MRKIIVGLFLTFVLLAHSQQSFVKKWDHRYGGVYSDFFRCFLEDKTGGYLIAGNSFSPAGGDKSESNWDSTFSTADFWVVKIDSDGILEWEKRFGGSGKDEVACVIACLHGGYILGGTTSSNSTGDVTMPTLDTSQSKADYWIIKIDDSGNKLWDRRYGGLSADVFKSLLATPDGGYFIGGSSESGIGGDKSQDSRGISDFWVVKVDSVGNKQWDKRFGGSKSETLAVLQKTWDKGYILGGTSFSDSTGDKSEPNWTNSLLYPDMWIVKIDSLGNKQWDRRLGGYGIDVLNDLILTEDEGYLLAGQSLSQMGGDKSEMTYGTGPDYWVVKVDSIGQKVWDKSFGGSTSENAQSVCSTSDGGFLISGTSQSPLSGQKTENNLGLSQVWLIKTDSIGNKQWDKTIQSPDGEEYTWEGHAIQTLDSCYTIATYVSGGIGGYCSQPNRDSLALSSDYWIVKFCKETPNSIKDEFPSETLIHPNPTKDKLVLTVANTTSRSAIQILSVEGRVLPVDIMVNGNMFEVDIRSLPVGLYLLALQDEKQRVVKRFIKE